MNPTPRPGLFERLLRFLGVRRDPPGFLKDPPAPPDSSVREPRRPKPSAPGGAATVELLDTETEDHS